MFIKKEPFKKQSAACRGLSIGLAITGIIPFCSNAQDNKYNMDKQPNIIWFIAEDITQQLSMYGDSTANTPHIDRLAREGVVFNNCYAVSGVCAPSRSALITSSYPTSIGTHNMRVNWATPDEIENYWVPLPDNLKTFTQHLRQAGYFCTNNAKEDYNFNVGYADWDLNSENAHWSKRPDPGQPFFSVFTSNTTHESRLWKHSQHPLRVDPEEVTIPPYYPDTRNVRKEMARSYSNIEEMDAEVGILYQQLEEANLLDQTIFIFIGDNGGPLPRQKRELYDGGIRVPLIIRFPGMENAGTENDHMISFVDLGVSMLSIANIPIPDYYQGTPFLGDQKTKPREYIFAAHDRLDKKYDMVRAVRDKQFKYIRNYKPDIPCYLHVEYRLQLEMMKEMLQMHGEGRLNEKQEIWFHATKPAEELYDTWEDPHELVNLADDPRYTSKLSELRSKLIDWQEKYGDMGFIKEENLFHYFWPKGKQPKTAKPVIDYNNNRVTVSCETPGAHLVYKFVPDGGQKKPPYPLYQGAVTVNYNGVFYCRGERYGFHPSDWVKLEIKK